MNIKRKPTLMEFINYEIIRRSGKFNMIMQADKAAKAAGLNTWEYVNVINNYDWCMNKWRDRKFHVICHLIDNSGVDYPTLNYRDDGTPSIYNLDDAINSLIKGRLEDQPNYNWELEEIHQKI